MADLKVNIGGLLLRNPVMTASGTFGYGEEFADFVDLSRLGWVIVKGRRCIIEKATRILAWPKRLRECSTQ